MKPLFSSFTPGYKIAWLFVCLLVGIITAGTLTNLVLMIPGVGSGSGVTEIWVSSAMQAVFGIGLPAYFVAMLTHASPIRYLKMTNNGRMGEKVLFAVSVFIVSYCMVSFLAQWNKGMVLPASMREIEELLRHMENEALKATNLLLSGKTTGVLILNLIVVAGLAAISEEMFFRGALQQFIQEKFPNGHVAVWMAALVFSIVHFQFYGFLPRLLLGALMGYLFLYTRNLWIPILFHFINNAFIVVMHYFWGDSEWMQQLDGMPVNGWFALAAVVSAVCTVLLFWGYVKRNGQWTIDNYVSQRLNF